MNKLDINDPNYLNEEYKSKAQNLYKKFVGKDSLSTRIKEKSSNELGGLPIKEWFGVVSDEGVKFESQGLSHRKKNIEDLVKGHSIDTINSKRRGAKYFNKTELVDDIQAYVDELEKLLGKEAHLILKKRYSLYGDKWYAYFLNYEPQNPNKDIKGDNSLEPYLGRGVLKVELCDVPERDKALFWAEHSHLKERRFTVLFENVKDEHSVDYYGEYYKTRGVEKRTVVFNLYSKIIGRQVHIKVHFEKGHDVMLGMYTTFEGAKISSGTILFQKIDPTIDPNPKPNMYSFFKNLNEYKQIDKDIIEFFALKSRSHIDVFQNVTTLGQLVEAEQDYSMLKMRKSFFLEKPEPEMFISIPPKLGLQNGETDKTGKKEVNKNKDGAYKIADQLIKEYGPIASDSTSDRDVVNRRDWELRITVNRFSKELPPDKHYPEENEEHWPDPYRNFKYIKTIRYFILFVDDVKTINYGVMEFALATAYAKVVILIYKEDLVSDTIIHLNDKKKYDEPLFVSYQFKKDIAKEASDIYQFIKDVIDKDLAGKV